MNRYLKTYILQDLSSKIVLVTGPRQCGKTTLAKRLLPSFDYFNYDAEQDRLALQKKAWNRDSSLLIFDELHKMRQWKRWLKGIYDTEGLVPNILVTGSAKLNTYRKAGDSLAGRYFQYRLHPLDVKEAYHFWKEDAEEIFKRLFHYGGFPEPFLKGSEIYYKRWRRSHLDIILRQDLIDLHSVRDVQAIETLVALLKQRAGSCISYANLARDLERDANTIKHWLQLLEELYVIFRVTPYHKNVARSLLKEPKFYFYDCAQTEIEPGVRLENIVASALLKELHFIEDITGSKTALHYLRTKDGKEIDFLVCIDDQPCQMIEVKWSEGEPSASFKHFQKFFPKIPQYQLVKELRRENSYPSGVKVVNAVSWLVHFNLTPMTTAASPL